MASKFSMEQMITTLSAVSRMTSSSYSFQPSTLRSTRQVPRGDCRSAHSTMGPKSSSL